MPKPRIIEAVSIHAAGECEAVGCDEMASVLFWYAETPGATLRVCLAHYCNEVSLEYETTVPKTVDEAVHLALDLTMKLPDIREEVARAAALAGPTGLRVLVRRHKTFAGLIKEILIVWAGCHTYSPSDEA